jgi:hypothetical protein
MQNGENLPLSLSLSLSHIDVDPPQEDHFPRVSPYGFPHLFQTVCPGFGNRPRISERSDLARIINKAKVKQLVTKAGAVCGVIYEKKGKDFTEEGPVILATGGFGADFTDDSGWNIDEVFFFHFFLRYFSSIYIFFSSILIHVHPFSFTF